MRTRYVTTPTAPVQYADRDEAVQAIKAAIAEEYRATAMSLDEPDVPEDRPIKVHVASFAVGLVLRKRLSREEQAVTQFLVQGMA